MTLIFNSLNPPRKNNNKQLVCAILYENQLFIIVFHVKTSWKMICINLTLRPTLIKARSVSMLVSKSDWYKSRCLELVRYWGRCPPNKKPLLTLDDFGLGDTVFVRLEYAESCVGTSSLASWSWISSIILHSLEEKYIRTTLKTSIFAEFWTFCAKQLEQTRADCKQQCFNQLKKYIL